MPTVETIEEFIKSVAMEPHPLVIEKFYTEDASIQENQNPPRVGRKNLIENEQKMFDKALKVTSTCIRPFFVEGDAVVIRWFFRFDWKDGSFTEIEELVIQTWEGEKIKKEQFFYDPKQFVPQKA